MPWLTDDQNETNMSQSISDSDIDSADDSNDQLFISCSFFLSCSYRCCICVGVHLTGYKSASSTTMGGWRKKWQKYAQFGKQWILKCTLAVDHYQEITGSIQFRLRTLCSRVEIEYVLYILQAVLFVPYTWANNISLVSFYYRLLLGFSIGSAYYGAQGYFWRQDIIVDNSMYKFGERWHLFTVTVFLMSWLLGGVGDSLWPTLS